MLGLYIHVPFCSAICNYCNFNRGLFDAALKGAVCRGADCRDPPGGRCRDGRQSVAECPGRHDLFRRRHAVAARTGRDPADHRGLRAELRCRPGPRSHARSQPRKRHRRTSRGLPSAGVNRLSFGVQSFRDDELERLSRLHGAARARAAYHEARRGGVRQHQPRSDDVAARPAVSTSGSSRSMPRSRSVPSICRSICSRCIRTRR